MYPVFVIHSSVAYLDYFPFPTTVTRAAMSMAEQASGEQDAESFDLLRSARAGSYGRFVVSFLSTHHTDFQSGCTRLQFHQQWMRAPLPPHPLQLVWSIVLLILVVLSAWDKVKVALICIVLLLMITNFFLFIEICSHFYFFIWELCSAR